MLDASTVAALMAGDHDDPLAVLGLHPLGDAATPTGWVLRALLPGAVGVTALAREGGAPLAVLQRIPGSDLFEAELPLAAQAPGDRPVDKPVYVLEVDWGSHRQVLEDAYRFGVLLGAADLWLLAEGTHHRPYEQLGAHPLEIGGVRGTRFAVWAPSARRVSVVGGFNNWDGRRHMMRCRREAGVWELFVPHVGVGDLYKFEIKGADGQLHVKADPLAFRAEMRPQTASVVQGLPPVVPGDAARRQANALGAPISIYEVHLGSWRRNDRGEWLSYRELAEQLVPYARDLGFTHLELLPVNEHPFDGSWGYQPTGLYAPTSRFGTPDDFRAFVAAAHAAGLGVIVDWVPGHFPTDRHGLGQFDGSHLYEHADPREGFHQDWQTLIYNYGRTEVRNFLVGNALYWLERYGIDGLRVDAVASMLYRDYSRKAGEWVPNRWGGRENLEAMDFLRRMNHIVGTQRPEAMTLAEESTAFPGVSRPPSPDLQAGGLGFHFKWNMGWMNDTLRYMQQDPVHRRYHHDQMRFSLMYAFSENFVLPLSHDEVVHGKRSLLEKMPGDDWQKFANLRAYYGYMWGHPGKKLLFMGGEFGQRSEWNEDAQLEWPRLGEARHAGLARLVRDLNAVYRDFGALHQLDHEPAGFAWLNHDDAMNSVLAFERRGSDPAGAPRVLVLCNFTPVVREGYCVGVPEPGRWRELINTDASVYGGSGVHNPVLQSQARPLHGQAQSLTLTLPPLATLMLVREPD